MAAVPRPDTSVGRDNCSPSLHNLGIDVGTTKVWRKVIRFHAIDAGLASRGRSPGRTGLCLRSHVGRVRQLAGFLGLGGTRLRLLPAGTVRSGQGLRFAANADVPTNGAHGTYVDQATRSCKEDQ